MSPLRNEAAVPVEYRLFGLDRRLIWPTVSVYLVVFLWSGVMPAINEAVHNKEVLAGTAYNVGSVSFTPTQGWVLTKAPFPAGNSSTAEVFKDGVTFSVKSGVWKGTAEELLNQIVKDQNEFVVEGKPVPITTLQKVAGVAKRINSPNYTGLLLAYVDGKGQGIEVIVKGPAATSTQLEQPIADMIKSITFKPKEGD
ncbi:hypothetical protein A4S05_20120 [Nostoc sp. KVJ20]|uniref:hypothetical protein n=1 Tax=Nostoc sp. KVJ20 TaxID=457944 RepID=UPI00083E2065|nr:hypothetical protein [Nostoc sp. KVJ20]ODH03348.1 hypothetical protein A4S05_20120 [Nostoc sp. KVJ20]